MESLIGQSPESLANRLAPWALPSYRVTQILQWIYQRAATNFQAMTNLPHCLRQQLEAEFTLYTTQVHRTCGDQQGTLKLALQLADHHIIESVLIRHAKRRTVCLSSQVGCAVGCVFCASGSQGLERNLRVGEMVEQWLHLARLSPHPLTHIVVMGMGEPLANPALPLFLEIASAPWGLGISRRRITISTAGLVPGIKRLAAGQKGVGLAISLHTPDPDLRQQLMPHLPFSIHEIIQAARHFFQATGRAVTFEMVLLAGVNDSPAQARRLARLIRGFPAKVNLIPYNPVASSTYTPPNAAAIRQYQRTLQNAGISVTVRQSKGRRLNAACGQLRLQALASAATAPHRCQP